MSLAPGLSVRNVTDSSDACGSVKGVLGNEEFRLHRRPKFSGRSETHVSSVIDWANPTLAKSAPKQLTRTCLSPLCGTCSLQRHVYIYSFDIRMFSFNCPSCYIRTTHHCGVLYRSP